MAILAAQFHDIQTGFGFQRVVRVDADLDKVLEDTPHVAAAVVDDRQTGGMAGFHHGRQAGLVPFAPIVGMEEKVLAIGDIAPDDHAIDQAIGGLDLSLEHGKRPFIGALHELAELVRVETHPEQQVLRPDDAGHVLVRLALAAENGNGGALLLDRLDPRRQVAGIAVAHTGDLVVATAEKTAWVGGIVEYKRLRLLDRVGLEANELGHRIAELLAQDCLKSGADDDLFLGLAQHLERLDVGIHIGNGHRPVEVVMLIDVGVGRQTFFLTPAIQEAPPEEIADRDAIRLFVPERLVHAFQFLETILGSLHSRGSPVRRMRLTLLKAHVTQERESWVTW